MEFYLVTIGLILIIPIGLWIHAKLSTSWDNSPTCLVGKTAIVTGANTGLGLYTALDLAKRGARVILACRDKNKAERARTTIIEKTGNTNVVVKLLNLASLKSIRNFVDQINRTEQCLHILVNNAGIISHDNIITEDGLEVTMQTNHYGPFLLTILLTDLLKRSAPSRVVNVSSLSVYFTCFNVDRLHKVAGWRSVKYPTSKLSNLIFSNELAKRLKYSNVTVNAADPGIVDTEMARGFVSNGKYLPSIFTRLVLKTPEEGAQTIIYAAVSKELEGVTGRFLSYCSTKNLFPMPKSASDEDSRRKLWEKSAQLVKLSLDEIKL